MFCYLNAEHIQQRAQPEGLTGDTGYHGEASQCTEGPESHSTALCGWSRLLFFLFDILSIILPTEILDL